jgi:hypothetical protein
MGNKVDIINEVYTRLNTALGVGKDLASVKRVQIGAREECRKLNDFPVINVRFMGGEELYHSQPYTKVDKIKLEIALITNPLDAENSLYKTADSTGGLYLFEKMLNTLDKTTAGAIDLGFANKGDNIPKYEYDVEYIDQFVEYTVKFEVESKQFLAGSR